MDKTKNLNSEKKSGEKRYILVIDLGTGGPKAGVVSDLGEIMSSSFEKTSIHFLPGHGAEQDPEEWWLCAKKAAKKAVDSSGVSAEEIVAISCDSQYFVVVPLDRNAEPLMNAVSWQDNRGGPYSRAISRGILNIEGYGITKLMKWIRMTGLAPMKSGVDSLGHILYIKNARPDVFKNTSVFLEPMDYLTFRLSGRITATQETMLTMLVVDLRKPAHLEDTDSLLKMAGL
ncbi:MAG: xylulose kinase, partial [Proteobacteria bacterium]|nr:xylulose kinase [Pseudomonadota bacterium]